MEEQLTRGEQTLLFLNRRGFSPWVVCDGCGEVLSCPNCSVTLTYHRFRRRALCHYCDHSIPFPPLCPHCGGGDFTLLGKGTERIEVELTRLFPSARIARLDRDTTARRGSHAKILDEVGRGEIDILVGTQMIAKGHDFPTVTLVGVISADDSLDVPDLWSAERTFQLLSQVLGRSGRGEKPGRVIIQTNRPDHYAVSAALSHDYERFYREELHYRSEAVYPPFARLSLLIFTSNDERIVEAVSAQVSDILREVKHEQHLRVEILGPALPPLAVVRGRHRRHILLKTRSFSEMQKIVNEMYRRVVIPKNVRMTIDVDPVDML
jgi:primosomal protein N' (replication factor Y)